MISLDRNVSPEGLAVHHIGNYLLPCLSKTKSNLASDVRRFYDNRVAALLFMLLCLMSQW